MLLTFCNNQVTVAELEKSAVFVCSVAEKSNPNYDAAKCPANPVFATLPKTFLNWSVWVSNPFS